MIQVSLTAAEQEYASEHYGLVNAYLNRKHLDENDFFDVVVFGYLRAVHQYLTDPKLLRFSFSTIAWRKMNDCLCAYRRYLNRSKRNAVTISLDIPRYRSGTLSLSEIVSAPDTGMLDFETEQLMLEMASKLSERQMRVLRMKVDGYGVMEIARQSQTTVNDVKALLESARDVVTAVCGG